MTFPGSFPGEIFLGNSDSSIALGSQKVKQGFPLPPIFLLEDPQADKRLLLMLEIINLIKN